MTPLDFARELGAVDGNAFAIEPTLQQSAYFRTPNRDRRVGGPLPRRRRHPSRRRHPRRAARRRGHRRARRGRPPRAREDGRVSATAARRGARRPRSGWRGRSRSRAGCCRRDVRDDVYLLYLVFRTLDDLVDDGRPEAEARIAAVEAWCDGRRPTAAADARGRASSTGLAARHPLPRDALADFCAGMRYDLAAERHPHRGRRRPLLLPRRRDGRARRWRRCSARASPGARVPAAAALGMAMQRTNILRDIDEDLAAGRVYLAARDHRALRRLARAGRARGAAARPDRAARTRSTRRASRASRCCSRGRRAVAAAAAMYREILRQIEREGYGARPGRAVVPAPRKLAVAARRGVLVR